MTQRSLPDRAAIAATLVALFALPPGLAAAERIEIDGVLNIRNGAEPRDGVETWRLEPLWSIGDDDDDALFGRINEAHSDAAGNIYLLDGQLSQATVYSPAGEFLRTLGREGEGPGEVRRPMGMVFMPNGNVGFLQPYPGKIIQVTRTGEPAGTVILGEGSSMVYNADATAGRLVVSGVDVRQEPGFQDRNSFISLVDDEGKEIVRYADHHYRFEFEDWAFIERDMHFPYWLWTMDDDGRIYVALERNRYAITVMDREGNVERVIEREFESRRRSKEDLKRADDRLVNMARNVPFPTRNVVEETDPDVAGLRIGGDGSLWVHTSRGYQDLPDGIMRRYDVFDASGMFVKQVELALDGCDSRDWLMIVDDGHAVVRSEPHDEEEGEVGSAADIAAPTIITCYALRGPGVK